MANVDDDNGDYLRRHENRYRARGRVAPWLRGHSGARREGAILGPDSRPVFIPVSLFMAASSGPPTYRRLVAKRLFLRLVMDAYSDDDADGRGHPESWTRRLFRVVMDWLLSHETNDAPPRHGPLRDVDAPRPPPVSTVVLTDSLTRAANAPGLCRVAA